MTTVALATFLMGVVVSAAITQGVPARLDDYRLGEDPSGQWHLGTRLREISGLAMTRDGRLLGHNDEHAIIYEIDQASGTLRKGWAFGTPTVSGDFEGITVVDDMVYLVTGTGRLYEGAEGNDGDRVPFNMYDTGVGSRCEVEGLSYDAETRMLLLPCKTPHEKDLEDFVTVFQWSLDARSTPADVRMRLPIEEVERRLGQRRFRPSGIAVHPVTGSFFVLASQGGAAIIEVSAQGQLLGAVELDGNRHGQPEGIAITPDRRLWIADEGGRGRGRLSQYRPIR